MYFFGSKKCKQDLEFFFFFFEVSHSELLQTLACRLRTLNVTSLSRDLPFSLELISKQCRENDTHVKNWCFKTMNVKQQQCFFYPILGALRKVSFPSASSVVLWLLGGTSWKEKVRWEWEEERGGSELLNKVNSTSSNIFCRRYSQAFSWPELERRPSLRTSQAT